MFEHGVLQQIWLKPGTFLLASHGHSVTVMLPLVTMQQEEARRNKEVEGWVKGWWLWVAKRSVSDYSNLAIVRCPLSLGFSNNILESVFVIRCKGEKVRSPLGPSVLFPCGFSFNCYWNFFHSYCPLIIFVNNRICSVPRTCFGVQLRQLLLMGSVELNLSSLIPDNGSISHFSNVVFEETQNNGQWPKW